MFKKMKTVEVGITDFLKDDWVAYQEFKGADGKDYLVQVVQDSDLCSPREDCYNLWTWTTTRNAGYSDDHAVSLGYIDENGKSFREENVVCRLYLYRHSGDVIYTSREEASRFDPWGFDSGCMGLAYVSKEKLRDEYNCKRITKVVLDKAYKCLEAEVKAMNMANAGEVYGVVCTELDSEDEDSCWGYYLDGRGEIVEAVSDHVRGSAGSAVVVDKDTMTWRY
jgi:hypothetical protein